jgi:glycosyltransferase involved in cell wall biosynthesis
MKHPDTEIQGYIRRGMEITRRSGTVDNAIGQESAVRPQGGSPACSIIVCSPDNSRFSQLKDNINRLFSSPVQIIRIQDATSLAEGYNRGRQQARGRICIFCHDDIEFLTPDVDKLIAEDLEAYDIVGVAGTTRLAGSRWIDAGQPFIHGMVGHRQPDQTYMLSQYGMGRDPDIVDNIQALDGLFFAVRRPLLESLSFDAERFDGFHFYDLDFTFYAWLRGFKLAVDQRIHLVHGSSGRYDQIWQHYAERFNKKYISHIPSNLSPQKPFFKNVTAASKTELQQVMHRSMRSRRHYLHKGKAFGDRLPHEDNSMGYIGIQDGLAIAPDKVHWMNEFYRVCDNGAIVEMAMAWPGQRHADQHPYWPFHEFYCFDIRQPHYLKFGRKRGYQGAFVLQRLKVTNEADERRLEVVYQAVKNENNIVAMIRQGTSTDREQVIQPSAITPVPRFSIIVPHYQGAIAHDIFCRGIESIRRQTSRDFEILCYHDGPLLEPDLNFPVQIFPTRKRYKDWGHSLRDIGIHEARGEYLLFFNPDNVMYPGLLEQLSRWDTDILVFPIKMMGMQTAGGTPYYTGTRDPSKSIVLTGNPVEYGKIDCMQFVMRRECWIEAGGWFDKRENSDGFMYNLFAQEYEVSYLNGEPMGEHW